MNKTHALSVGGFQADKYIANHQQLNLNAIQPVNTTPFTLTFSNMPEASASANAVLNKLIKPATASGQNDDQGQLSDIVI